MTQKELQTLKETAFYEDKHFWYFKKPARKGEVHNGFKNEKTKPKYQWRVKVVAKPAFKKLLNQV